MKEEVFYILLLFFTVIFTVSEQDTNNNTQNEHPTFQSIDAAKELKCIVHQFKFELKKNLPSLINHQRLSQNCLEGNLSSKVNSTLTSLRLSHLKLIELKPVRLILYQPRLYHSSKNQDEHHLS